MALAAGSLSWEHWTTEQSYLCVNVWNFHWRHWTKCLFSLSTPQRKKEISKKSLFRWQKHLMAKMHKKLCFKYKTCTCGPKLNLREYPISFWENNFIHFRLVQLLILIISTPFVMSFWFTYLFIYFGQQWTFNVFSLFASPVILRVTAELHLSCVGSNC